MSTKQADHVELGDVEGWNNGPEDTISRLALRVRNRFFILDQLQSYMAASIRCVRGTLLDEDLNKFI
ncbi:hypothetical protein DPMN_077784 [Dreissena polymorpha]|uniref:Uncharacterized protein n=1 Tax=Dreissena polymorpha TaxID=45954 RepID=A0A9D3YPF6_DREPO|nr:hypothetical protein DPMN_077784 [Dreissena polymorpha]